MFSFPTETFSVLGYLSMVGPPRALHLHRRAHADGGELAGQPLLVVVIIEAMVRGGILLMTAVAIESMIGKGNFDIYRIDWLFGALLGAGVLHTTAYYFFVGRSDPGGAKTKRRLYRLCRNLAYSVVPGFGSSVVAIVWQHINQIDLFSGDVVELTYFMTFALAAVIGTIEALVANREPSGLNQGHPPPYHAQDSDSK